MREIRTMARGMLCAVLVGAAYAQQGPREGRRVGTRAPREAGMGDRAPAALTGDMPVEAHAGDAPTPPSAERAAAVETTDYTRLLEQFLQRDDERLEVVFYRCKYVSAETMRRLLENFLTPAGTVGRSDEDDVVVVSDVPSRLPQLKQILEQADHPVGQVLVEARIVELEISDDLVRDIHMGIAKMGESDSVRKIFQELLIPNSAGTGVEDLQHSFSAGKARMGGSGHSSVSIRSRFGR